MIDEGTMVLPGDRLAAAEELQAGSGTYERDGDIIASVTGRFAVDKRDLKAKVAPAPKTPLLLKKGDIAICEVKQVMESMVIVNILQISGKKRQIAVDNDAAIHVSNISNSYVESTGQMFRVGDILRAKIIETGGSIRLAKKDRDLGVIKAYCTRCRNPLELNGNKLECSVCGRVEERRIAPDYGRGYIGGV
jgi:exosome complex component CSL4